MSYPKFEYIAAQTLEEASNLALELGDKCKIMAGGTDILVAMRDRKLLPEQIVDIKRVPNLNEIEITENGALKIGALAKLQDIAMNEGVKANFKAVADAAHYVASTQVRSKGTMAGNVVNASPSADTPPILLALNAEMKTFNAKTGERTIPMNEFYTGFRKTALNPGDIVTGFEIPALGAGEGAAYYKHSVRKAMDLAIVGVAAWVKMDGNVITDCRITLGAVDITVIRAYEAENILKGKEFSEELLKEASVAAMECCHPISDVRASAEYRQDMIRVFTKRAVKSAMESVNA